MELDRDTVAAAAARVRDAQALLIGAGAGMGVDSGLPDFRGNEGFWKAYPPFAKRGLSFVDMANPAWFDDDPRLAWGFYGHRLNLYRDTEPHDGFHILSRWAERMAHGAFVFTSNVDGQFQRAGYDDDRVVECHGSLNHLQCVRDCRGRIWSAADARVDVDPESFQASPPLPDCPDCGGLARPNILMFGDWGWRHDRTNEQERRLDAWMQAVDGDNLVIVELGAGSAVPTVRYTCERIAESLGGTLVRINPREPQASRGALSFAHGALETLRAIDDALTG